MNKIEETGTKKTLEDPLSEMNNWDWMLWKANRLLFTPKQLITEEILVSQIMKMIHFQTILERFRQLSLDLLMV